MQIKFHASSSFPFSHKVIRPQGMKRRPSFIESNAKEARRISRKSVPIRVIVYAPKTEKGKHELAMRAAEVHADAVLRAVGRLNCPSEQKAMLVNAVIEMGKNAECTSHCVLI